VRVTNTSSQVIRYTRPMRLLREWLAYRRVRRDVKRQLRLLDRVFAAIFTTADLPTVSIEQVGQKKKGKK